MEGQVLDIEAKTAIAVRGGVEFASGSLDPPQENSFPVGGERPDLARTVPCQALIARRQFDTFQRAALEFVGP